MRLLPNVHNPRLSSLPSSHNDSDSAVLLVLVGMPEPYGIALTCRFVRCHNQMYSSYRGDFLCRHHNSDNDLFSTMFSASRFASSYQWLWLVNKRLPNLNRYFVTNNAWNRITCWLHVSKTLCRLHHTTHRSVVVSLEVRQLHQVTYIIDGKVLVTLSNVFDAIKCHRSPLIISVTVASIDCFGGHLVHFYSLHWSDGGLCWSSYPELGLAAIAQLFWHLREFPDTWLVLPISFFER